MRVRTTGVLALATAIVATVTLVVAIAASAAGPCGVCGKNLIKNPGADLGRGVNAVDAFGAVPGWTVAAGQFGAASYAFPNGWFSARSKGPKNRGKNYFFGGTTRAAIEAQASIGHRRSRCRRPRSGERHPQRLARELRREQVASARPVPGRVGRTAVDRQDRPGRDDRGLRHGAAQPQRQGSRKDDPGDDLRDPFGRRTRLQARGSGQPLTRAELKHGVRALRVRSRPRPARSGPGLLPRTVRRGQCAQCLRRYASSVPSPLSATAAPWRCPPSRRGCLRRWQSPTGGRSASTS